jgi:hypothetical protein
MWFLKYCVPKDQHNNLEFWESAKCENEKSKKTTWFRGQNELILDIWDVQMIKYNLKDKAHVNNIKK